MSRIILHCDLDCFFAAVEMRDNPEYRKEPVVIGADPKGGKGRGVVSTCSYEAREYGLHSAMPISRAYKLCPHAIYLRPNHQKYSKVSKNVMKVFKRYTDIFQKVSIDEAYIEITEKCTNLCEARKIAQKIQEEVKRKVGITVSIGIGSTKSIAKIASDFKKPEGITCVPSDKIKDFLKNMEITRIPGIGKKTKKIYHREGIKKISDFYDFKLYELTEKFGKSAKWIWKVINGSDKRPLEQEHERKSISKERTFREDVTNKNLIISTLEKLNLKVHQKARDLNIFYRTITLKVRNEDFETFTRSSSFLYPLRNQKLVLNQILELYQEFHEINKKIRLVGVKISNFSECETFQTNLLNFIQV
ncbi:MAG: DNA polymerase IV [Promethearchaeia archaeon]